MQPSPPHFPPFGGGGSGGSGGGSQGGGSATGTGVFVPISNGGVFAQQRAAMYPVLNLITGNTDYFSFNPLLPPNDIVAGSNYSWRAEMKKPARSYTVRGIVWTFTDLGQVSVTWTLTGVNTKQQVITRTTSLGVGNRIPTNAIMSVVVDITQTGMNQQLSVSRLAGQGPLSVVHVLMFGDMEENTL